MQTKNSFPPFLTQQEACKYLHIAPSTFNKWDREYHIPVIRIEGVKRYKKDSLDEFMKKLER
ncbi:helix-turn-helix domain-containing protein [Limosilactobacillus reuteri]|uniref:helix-turn-helix domain-containing protein n=1 Tax=Limosilactobacillus reuteri TaxID=1598 RepID=UPI003984E3CC|nr:helix-turn-helix domain-containing protein [Limosilactobacillus reuteri]